MSEHIREQCLVLFGRPTECEYTLAVSCQSLSRLYTSMQVCESTGYLCLERARRAPARTSSATAEQALITRIRRGNDVFSHVCAHETPNESIYVLTVVWRVWGQEESRCKAVALYAFLGSTCRAFGLSPLHRLAIAVAVEWKGAAPQDEEAQDAPSWIPIHMLRTCLD